jgi:membrane protease YdiL (CAAX protease family)
VGVLALQVVGAVVGALLFAAEETRDALQACIDTGEVVLPDLTEQQVVQIVGTAQTVLLLGCLLAVGLAFRGQTRRRIPTGLPALRHVGLVLLLVLPLALLGGFLQQSVVEGLHAAAPPDEEAPEVSELMEAFQRLAQSTSLPVVLYILAVTPAVAEEVVFRGVIGRGLLARYGLVGGVVLTSLLFGLTHLNLPQSVGVIPIGVAMHVAYLATGSFWTPVAMHFLNNALSAVTLRADKLAEATLPWPAALAALAAVVALVALMWQTRVEYRRPDGTPLVPLFPTVEPPPDDADRVKTFHTPPGWLVVAAGLSFGAFVALLVVNGPG